MSIFKIHVDTCNKPTTLSVKKNRNVIPKKKIFCCHRFVFLRQQLSQDMLGNMENGILSPVYNKPQIYIYVLELKL